MVMSRMSDQIGRVLSGRYRLIAPIGTGASAQVFLAEDTRLRRRVAVKLLHAALADDDAFLRRFRAEAQAAAALNHPNVMAVYDWGEAIESSQPGESVDQAYLVTEYLGGGSLRSMLDKGYRLSTSQALLVGLEATRGLDYAHKRGFVHRDIKPANLLFGDDQRLRIADFGLARALAEAAWTEPAGAVLGTARYASPEQARGEPVDGKGDVYSLALVLVEAVTGTVPFAADTTIGTLMARVDKPLEVPEELGSLRSVLERAGRPDPADRPDAGDFAVGLMAAAEDLARPLPLPLVGATGQVSDVTVVDRDPTMLPPARASDLTVFDHEQVTDDDQGKPGRRAQRRARKATKAAGIASGRIRRRRWPKIALVVLLVLALSAGSAYAFVTLRVPTHELPNLVGLDEAQARGLVKDLGFDIVKKEDRRDGTTPGEVLAQDPVKGQRLKEGHTLTITVSLGNTLVPVPTNLVGASTADALIALQTAQLVLGAVTPQFDEGVPVDHVIAVAADLPAELPKGAPVDLVVSQGPQPRTVPALPPNATFDQAAAALTAVQLQAAQGEEFSDTVPAGTVIRLDPATGAQLPRDAVVTVVVSKGVELIPIPEVKGLSLDQAVAAIQAAGLVPGQVFGPATGKPDSTSPNVGTKVPRGSVVDIYLKK